MRRHVERLIQHEVKPRAVFASRHPPSAVFFIHTSIGSALLLYCTSWLSSSEQFSLILKPLRFLVIKISGSVYIIYF